MPSSMSLNATPSRPISVLGSDSSTRRSRSPCAMSSAAVAIDSSGLSSRRITRLAVAPSSTSRPAVTSSSIRTSRRKVASTSFSGIQATRYPGPPSIEIGKPWAR